MEVKVFFKITLLFFFPHVVLEIKAKQTSMVEALNKNNEKSKRYMEGFA